jgi:hypothetical protein
MREWWNAMPASERATWAIFAVVLAAFVVGMPLWLFGTHRPDEPSVEAPAGDDPYAELRSISADVDHLVNPPKLKLDHLPLGYQGERWAMSPEPFWEDLPECVLEAETAFPKGLWNDSEWFRDTSERYWQRIQVGVATDGVRTPAECRGVFWGSVKILVAIKRYDCIIVKFHESDKMLAYHVLCWKSPGWVADPDDPNRISPRPYSRYEATAPVEHPALR